MGQLKRRLTILTVTCVYTFKAMSRSDISTSSLNKTEVPVELSMGVLPDWCASCCLLPMGMAEGSFIEGLEYL